MNILVSACLLGEDCRYDGKSNYNEEIFKLSLKHNLIPVCPEQIGGLPTPRVPAEIKLDRVINKNGEDVTNEFICGANKTLEIAKAFDCKYAILKSISPSCGVFKIYSGNFDKVLVDGNGVTGDILIKNNIIVFDENNFECLYEVDEISK
jgi:uncharacterized protein YbbK (DUF523 family)